MAALMTHCAGPSATTNLPQLSIPSIGLTRTVVIGDQPQIDQGNVVNYGDDDDRCWPGQGCTVWLTGHRTSHGSVFNRVPKLKAGDAMSVRYNGSTYAYVVTGSAFVDRLVPPVDYMRGDLMLQTSWTNGRVLLVYATLESS
ncbi:MAG: sortase [Ilumatobacteraceae bacterium]